MPPKKATTKKAAPKKAAPKKAAPKKAAPKKAAPKKAAPKKASKKETKASTAGKATPVAPLKLALSSQVPPQPTVSAGHGIPDDVVLDPNEPELPEEVEWDSAWEDAHTVYRDLPASMRFKALTEMLSGGYEHDFKAHPSFVRALLAHAF